MKVIRHSHEIYSQLSFARKGGSTNGLVPTMGALHEGHLSLVKLAKENCDLATVTIFVNPTQFAPHEDLAKYPRTLDEDLERLASVGTDFVFTPDQESIYPSGFSTYIEPPNVAQPLEGLFRPGHFRGVATIVLKLFNLVPADVAFFGSKDYQQLAVIQKMVADLDVPIRIEGCPTIRESDGLAMSSRNRYLNSEERKKGLGLWNALCRARTLLAEGEVSVPVLESAMQKVLVDSGVSSIDYARVVHHETLQDLQKVDSTAIAIIAARVGSTRLIDNLKLEVN